MSRDFTTDERDLSEHDEKREPGSRMALSQGRGGGSGAEEDRRKRASEADLVILRERIDQAAQGHPSVSEFLDRLAQTEVQPHPSIQSDGRWNGIVYTLGDVKVKGSTLGRSYTAKGLQQRKGVRYEPARDDQVLAKLAGDRPSPGREGLQSVERQQPERSHRLRSQDGLSADERLTLWDIGRFRTVDTADLVQARYGGRDSLLQRDVKHLLAERLIERRVVPVDGKGRTIAVLALTREGKALLKRSQGDDGQDLYHGFVKLREIVHDSALYRMFQAEARRIERDGGRVRRVVLDYEFKKRAYSPLAKAHDLPPLAYAERQEEIARENGLHVVEGCLVLPDVRVEYETADGEERHVDLELATQNYRAAHIRSKAAAGFRVYAQAKGGHLSTVLDNHDLIAELLG